MKQHHKSRDPSPPRPCKSRGTARTYETPRLEDIPLNPKRCFEVLRLIVQEHNWRHSSKNKGVSHKTMAERGRFCFWLFDFLRQPPWHFKLDPRSFGERHVVTVTQYWQAEAKAGRMSPATIQTYFSFMKTFVGWIGKAKMVKAIGRYFDDPNLYKRTLASSIDKSWRAQGVEFDEVIREVEAYDVRAAASLKLMRAFHLRFKESLMLRPHVDVISAARAKRPDNGIAFYLDTHRGTKGGRERMIPIDSPRREAAIDYARRVAMGAKDSVGDPRLDLDQALRRLRYVMERFGITRAALGVTPHGLRHQGAAEEYEAMTGQKPPVAGGKLVDRESDRRAREKISADLGHGRTVITSAYLGKPIAVRDKVQEKTPCNTPVMMGFDRVSAPSSESSHGQSSPANPVVLPQARSPIE